MSNYIKKTKEGEPFSFECYAPIRRVADGMTYEEMARAPITNAVSKFKSSSILSKLDGRNMTFTNIGGTTVNMVCKIHDEVFNDTVTVAGERGNFYIVEIDGVKYSVNKSCAMFTIN